MLRWEDSLRKNKFFRRAAAGATRCYLELARNKDALPTAAEEKASLEAIARRKEEVAKDSKKSASDFDKDPVGYHLARTKDPLAEAKKFVDLLVNDAKEFLETHVLRSQLARATGGDSFDKEAAEKIVAAGDEFFDDADSATKTDEITEALWANEKALLAKAVGANVLSGTQPVAFLASRAEAAESAVGIALAHAGLHALGETDAFSSMDLSSATASSAWELQKVLSLLRPTDAKAAEAFAKRITEIYPMSAFTC